MKNRRIFYLTLAIFGACCLSSSADADLVHRWSFENDLTDASGNGNDGTHLDATGGADFDGSVDYVAGRFGNALDINSAEGVQKTDANNLPLFAADAWTMNVWLNLDTAPANLNYFAGFGNHNVFNNDGTEGGNARGFLAAGTNLDGFYFWGLDAQPNPGADNDSGTPYLSDGQWHMYTIANDGANIDMYIDANLVFSDAAILADTPFNQVQVGNRSIWNATTRTQIDEFSIWNEGLDQNQITSLFNTNAVPEPSSALLVSLLLVVVATKRRR